MASLTEPVIKNIQLALLVGGLATRLGDLAKNQPKSLVEVLHKPFLEYQLNSLKQNGVTDVVLCLGHLGEQIQARLGDSSNHVIRIKYSKENKPLGTAGALKNAEALLDDIFFVMYGDSYLFLNFKEIMSYFVQQDKLALVTVLRNNDVYDKSNMAIKGNMVIKYCKTSQTEDMTCIDYGASILRKEVLELIPRDEFYSLEDLFGQLIKMGQLMALEVTERFYEIGSPQGLQDFEEYAKIYLC